MKAIGHYILLKHATTWRTRLILRILSALDLKPAVVMNDPILRKLFMKKLTRGASVSTISASISWLILGTTTSGPPSLLNCASCKLSPAGLTGSSDDGCFASRSGTSLNIFIFRKIWLGESKGDFVRAA